MLTEEERERFVEFYRQIGDNIRTHGQHVQGVGASPPFFYTIGNAGAGLPELLMIGAFPLDIVMPALNIIGHNMREAGKAPEPGLLDIDWTYPFKLRECTPRARRDFTIQAGQFYRREDYRVMQVMLCDKAGRYQDDDACTLAKVELP